MKVVWILNPDAEAELSHLAHFESGPYHPTKATLKAMREKRGYFQELIGSDPAGFVGARAASDLQSSARPGPTWALFWCPTPSAILWAKGLGLSIPATPSVDVLIRANDKTKLALWGLPCVPERCIVASLDDARRQLEHHVMRCKRPFGWAGRGQRRLTSNLSADDERWLVDSLITQALIMEPELPPHRLVSAHYFVGAGRILTGSLVGYECDRFGAFSRFTEIVLAKNTSVSIIEQGLVAASRLNDHGYRGPVAVDFALTEDGNAFALDLNARFTLASGRGLSSVRAEMISLTLRNARPAHWPDTSE